MKIVYLWCFWNYLIFLYLFFRLGFLSEMHFTISDVSLKEWMNDVFSWLYTTCMTSQYWFLTLFKQVYKFYNEGFYYFVIKLAVSQTVSKWVFAIFRNTFVRKENIIFQAIFEVLYPLNHSPIFSYRILQTASGWEIREAGWWWVHVHGVSVAPKTAAWSSASLSAGKGCKATKAQEGKALKDGRTKE